MGGISITTCALYASRVIYLWAGPRVSKEAVFWREHARTLGWQVGFRGLWGSVYSPENENSLAFFFFPHISISNARDRVTDRKRSPHPRPWRFVNRSLPEPARPAGWCPVCLWLRPHLTAAVCVQTRRPPSVFMGQGLTAGSPSAGLAECGVRLWGPGVPRVCREAFPVLGRAGKCSNPRGPPVPAPSPLLP